MEARGHHAMAGFRPNRDAINLYVSYACPWAHRTLIFRALKGLEDHISVSAVHPDMLGDGWVFDDSYPAATIDHLHGKQFLRDVYLVAQPDVTTRVTVPVLWDTKTTPSFE